MTKKLIHVDLEPVKTFRYIQISNHQFNYLMLDESYKALHTPFQCKDYIQDMVYTEITGKSGEIYGMKWTKGMLDISKPTLRVALMWLNDDLTSIVQPTKKFINQFEKALGIPLSKVYKTDHKGIIVVEFSTKWTENGPLLSAFTTLLRLAGLYNGEDPIQYLLGLSKRNVPDYMKVDINRLMPKRFAALMQGMKPEHDWNSFSGMMSVHNTGICGFNAFPEVSI